MGSIKSFIICNRARSALTNKIKKLNISLKINIATVRKEAQADLIKYTFERGHFCMLIFFCVF